ncbi:MAG: PepSY-like domain-containing protein [Oligoflexus sp.]|nr:PepSY-like domain-containing protein [Pseudopedobacter sp.]
MKKKIFTAIIVVATFTSLNTFAQNIPAATKKSLTKTYPNAKDVKWEKENSNYEAGFQQDGKELSLVIDAKGNILETETAIKTTDLPQSVLSFLKSKFGNNLKIKDAAKIKKADGNIIYEAEVKGLDYLFDANGKFIKTAKD